MAIVVTYYFSVEGKVVTRLLGLPALKGESAEDLLKLLCEQLQLYNMDWSKCIGFAADTTNVTFGANNSIFLDYVLPLTVKFKTIFQSSHSMIHREVKDSRQLYVQILNCFFKPCTLKEPISQVVKLDPKTQAYHLPANKIYGGIKFARLLETTASKKDLQSTNQIFERLLQFLLELAIQLRRAPQPPVRPGVRVRAAARGGRSRPPGLLTADCCGWPRGVGLPWLRSREGNYDLGGSNMSVENITAKIPGIVRDEDEQKLDDEWRLLILSDDAKNMLSQNAVIDTEHFWAKLYHREIPTSFQTC
ncbi:hypothetical protein SK128_012280 [Halocaridina rubra]|uniref:Uncharacterized protein n=1 Tax=Halocaridina rubra TaxID=373956 RepID=A0AAN9AF27_HALRR